MRSGSLPKSGAHNSRQRNPSGLNSSVMSRPTKSWRVTGTGLPQKPKPCAINTISPPVILRQYPQSCAPRQSRTKHPLRRRRAGNSCTPKSLIRTSDPSWPHTSVHRRQTSKMCSSPRRATPAYGHKKHTEKDGQQELRRLCCLLNSASISRRCVLKKHRKQQRGRKR